MKRRKFFKCMVGVVATLALPVTLPEVEPEVIGVDVGAEGADATVVSLHRANATRGRGVSDLFPIGRPGLASMIKPEHGLFVDSSFVC